MTGQPSELSFDELRRRRRELQERDDAVSYVRRVAQGRADLARAELARREAGPAAPELTVELDPQGAPGRITGGALRGDAVPLNRWLVFNPDFPHFPRLPHAPRPATCN